MYRVLKIKINKSLGWFYDFNETEGVYENSTLFKSHYMGFKN